MEFKGTKGKWRMCFSDDGDLVSDVKYLDPSKLVCQIYKHKSIEGKANAKLIAHAPEMLEILNRIMKTYDKGTQTYIDCMELIKSATEV